MVELCDEVVVCTPEIEESWCHTASYTCAVAAIAALHGEDVSWLPGAVERALAAELPAVGEQERFLVAGTGRDLPTAHEAVLKLREGAWVAAEAYETEQLLHGYLAAVDESVRAFVLEGKGVAAERAQAAVAALRELGCDADLVPARHPVVDIVLFQRLAVQIAGQRGREPDRIRRHDPRWAAAAAAAKADNAA
jgi:fructoselysine-6-P-deglycase FrlB-like protein